MTVAKRARLARIPLEYPGASSGVKRSGPMTLPADEPIKTSAEVVLRLVSPAVFWADHEYIKGAGPVSRSRAGLG